MYFCQHYQASQEHLILKLFEKKIYKLFSFESYFQNAIANHLDTKKKNLERALKNVDTTIEELKSKKWKLIGNIYPE